MPNELSEDLALCRKLAQGGESLGSQKIYYLAREGRVLIAFNRSVDSACKAILIYRPQTSKAKIASRIAALAVRLRLWGFFSNFKVELGSESVLGKLLSESYHFGFLFGNPKASHRKILISYKKNKQYVVSKICYKDKEPDSLEKERRVIKSLPKVYRGIPEFFSEQDGGSWHGYTTKYISGRSPRKKHDAQLIDLLIEWSAHGSKAKISEMTRWENLMQYAQTRLSKKTQNELKNIENLKVLFCLGHGDFSPWNIIRSGHEDYTVIDWEAYDPEIPCGWDWLNYLIQRDLLTDKKEPVQALQTCIDFTEKEPGASLLRETGWGENQSLWILLYLVYSCAVLKLDRQNLVDEMETFLIKS